MLCPTRTCRPPVRTAVQNGPARPRHLQDRDDEDPVEHFEGQVHAAEPEEHEEEPEHEHAPGEGVLELVVPAHGLAQKLRQALGLEDALLLWWLLCTFGGA